jgi:hypothetical protein
LFYLRALREQLVEQPFAPLTQQYETCSNDPTTALFTQAGVSAGNVSLLSPLGVLLVLALLAAYQFCSGAHIPRTYSRGDKDAALDALATAMLLVRDKRLVSLSGTGGNDVSGGSGLASVQKHQTAGAPETEEPTAARKAVVLADLVEALSEVAAAAQQEPSLLHQSAQEPVFVDWNRVGAHLLGGGSALERERCRRRADSDDDDVELSTMSGMHQHPSDASVKGLSTVGPVRYIEDA